MFLLLKQKIDLVLLFLLRLHYLLLTQKFYANDSLLLSLKKLKRIHYL